MLAIRELALACVIIVPTLVAGARTLSLVDFTNTSIIYTPDSAWNLASDARSRFTITPGSSLTFAFFGTQILIHGAKNTKGAKWNIFMDDEQQPEVGDSARQGSKTLGLLVYDSGNLGDTNKLHTLRMVHTDEEGKAIDIQSFDVVSETQDASASAAAVSATSSSVAPSSAPSSVSATVSTGEPASLSSTSAPLSSSSVSGPVPSVDTSAVSSQTSGSVSSAVSSSSSETPATFSQLDRPTSNVAQASIPGASLAPFSTLDGTAVSALLSEAQSTGVVDPENAPKSFSVKLPLPLPLFLPLVIGLPLFFIFTAIFTYRCCLKKRREDRLARWSAEKGLAGLDFGCRGERSDLREQDGRWEWSSERSASRAGTAMSRNNSAGTRSGRTTTGRAL